MSERPRHRRPRRLADWINPTGERKVHSLVDKVYKRKNLEMAWERVKANRGAGGIDGQSLEEFSERLEEHLDRLHEELRRDDVPTATGAAEADSEGGPTGEVPHVGHTHDL